ncbi:hypothetical protein BDR03DRAFT_999620 [Suillus americanus]|nr:hypothetical protein BDR03DRAFT_999620 [Suillus americanus]
MAMFDLREETSVLDWFTQVHNFEAKSEREYPPENDGLFTKQEIINYFQAKFNTGAVSLPAIGETMFFLHLSGKIRSKTHRIVYKRAVSKSKFIIKGILEADYMDEYWDTR